MNQRLQMRPALFARIAQLTGVLFLSGCINLPREVKESVDETRSIVGDLHAAHAQEARAFARLVEKREADEKALREAVRRQAQERAKAEAEAFKAKTMADFERYAGDLLGIQFQDKVARDILPQFSSLEKGYTEALADVVAERAALPKDPSIAQKITTATRNLTDLDRQRASTVGAYFLALNAAIVKTRFNFETQATQRYDAELKTFVDSIASTDVGATADAALANFQLRTDAQLDRLDKSYYSVDHALSDISTFLDSEATSTRFIKHSIKGFAEALLDDIKTGQLGGAQLTGSFEDKINAFTKNLGQTSMALQDQAKTAVANAASSVSGVLPPVTGIPAPATSNP